MAELDAQIGLTADASGVEAGVGRAKKSLASLGASATKMGQDVAGAGDKASKALGGLGDGGEKSAKKIERDTKSMQSSIQRYIATLEAGSKDSRKYWEQMADFKGVDKNALRPLLDQLDRVTAKTKETESAANRLGGSFTTLRAAASVAIGSVVVQSAAQAATALYEASVQAERLRIMLDFSSARGSVREIAYLRAITSELGLAFGSTATAYSQFQAAARGTALEGEKSRAVFESIAKASAVMGLSAEQSSGVLLALQQMISKGTVQAEELRGQLGERLPGAFQIAARAMGVTTAELGKMLEQGQVIADDFLPKFAKALNESLGDSAEKAANRLDAATNRFSTAWERLKQNAGDSGISKFWAGQINILTDGMNDVSNSMDMARLSGSGFIGQMKAGAGAVLAFANPLNAFSYSAQDLGIKLRDAEKELEALKQAGAERSSNLMLREAFAHAQRLVDKYREAKAAQNALLGVEAEQDPRDQSNFKPRGASYQDYARQQADSEKALIEVRMRAAGVNKQYLADLKTYQDALKLGTMDHAQYIKAVSDLATTTYKSSAAGKEAEKGLKSGASEAKKAANEYQRLIDSINAKIAAEELELAGGEKLTDSQRLRVQFAQELQTSLKGLSAAKVAEYTADLNRLESLERENNARKEFLQIAEQERQQRLKIAQAAEQSVDSLATGNQQLRDEIQLIGLSAAEQMEVIRLREEAVLLVKEQHLAEMARAEDLTGTMTRERIALEQEIELRRERLNLMGDKATKEQFAESNREMTREWQRTVDQYGDVFRQGFADMLNNGKDGWKSFTRSLVTTFKTTVADQIYKMFAQPFVVNIVGNLLGVTGGGAGGAAMQIASGGSGSGVLGMGSNIASIFGAGGIGGSLMAGAGWLTGATTLGGSLTAGASLLGTGTLAGGAAGLGMIAGAVAPIALAAAALANVFGLFRKTEKRGYGLMGTLGEEDGVHSLDLMRKGGSLFGGPKWFVRDTGVSEMDKALQDTYKQQRDALMKMGEALGLATDHVKDFTVQLGSDELGDKKVRGIRLDGLSDEEAQKKIAEALATANNEIAQQIIGTWERTVREVERIDISRPTDVGDTTDYGVPNVIRESIVDERYIPSEFARDGEQAIDTLTRLATSITGVNAIFDTLGLSVYEASLSAADAASSFVDLFGGLENLNAAAQTYYQNFYSEDERRAKAREGMDKVFDDLGIERINYDDPEARKKYREIVEREQARMVQEQQNREALRANFTGLILPEGGMPDAGSIGDIVRDFLGDTVGEMTDGAMDQLNGLISDFDTGALSLEGFTGSVMELIGASDDAGLSAEETVAALLNASGAFAAVTQSSDDAAESARRLAEEEERKAEEARRKAEEAVDLAFRNLQAATDRQLKSIDKQREALSAQRDSYAESLSLITGIFDLVRSNARELYGEVADTASMQAAQGMEFVRNALTVAQRTGVLPESEALTQAIQAARGGLGENNFATQNEADFARLVLAGQLSALEAISGKQKTFEEQQIERLDGQLKGLDKQSKQLQEQLDYWREQIDISRGAFDATMSVDAAVRGIAALLGAKTPGDTGGGSSGKQPVFGGGGGARPSEQEPARYHRMRSGGTAGVFYEGIRDESLIERLDKLSPVYHAFDGTGDLVGLAEAFKAAGGTIADLSILSGNWESDWRKAFASVGIPAFAGGGMHAGGLRVVGERGWELEATGPARIWNQQQLGQALGGGSDAMVVELRALREENQRQAGEIVRLNLRVAKVLERWDGDGMPNARVEAAV